MHGGGNYTAVAIDRRAFPFSYTTGTFVLTITPSPLVSLTTPVVEITGTINTYFNTIGCNIAITGAYAPVK
jgi:hypothetical protein